MITGLKWTEAINVTLKQFYRNLDMSTTQNLLWEGVGCRETVSQAATYNCIPQNTKQPNIDINKLLYTEEDLKHAEKMFNDKPVAFNLT